MMTAAVTTTDDDAGTRLHPVTTAVANGIVDTIGDCRDALLALQLDDDPHPAAVLLGRAARRANRVAASLTAGDVR